MEKSSIVKHILYLFLQKDDNQNVFKLNRSFEKAVSATPTASTRDFSHTMGKSTFSGVHPKSTSNLENSETIKPILNVNVNNKLNIQNIQIKSVQNGTNSNSPRSVNNVNLKKSFEK